MYLNYLHFTIWTTLEGGVQHSTWVHGEAYFHLNGIIHKQILVLDCITSTSFKRECTDDTICICVAITIHDMIRIFCDNMADCSCLFGDSAKELYAAT